MLIHCPLGDVEVISQEYFHIDGIMQERRNSIAYALELRLSFLRIDILSKSSEIGLR